MAKVSSGARRHTHRYYNLEDGLWHCSLSNCSHFVPLNMPSSYILGKNSICWDCGKEFPMSEDSIEYDRPICFNCISGMKPKAIENLEDIIEEKMREARQKREREEFERRKKELLEQNELNHPIE